MNVGFANAAVSRVVLVKAVKRGYYPGMYRTPAKRESEPPPPRELVYEATDETAGRADGMAALFRHVSLPIVGSAAAALLGGETAAIATLAVASAFSVWSWRTRKKRGGAVLTVDGHMLAIELRGARTFHDRLNLSDLADVVLDTKTIQRVVEGPGAIPALRFVDSRVSPPVDTVRIVLVSTAGREMPLSTDYLPHVHGTEWMGKIRTFLRKHGWVPEDERE